MNLCSSCRGQHTQHSLFGDLQDKDRAAQPVWISPLVFFTVSSSCNPGKAPVGGAFTCTPAGLTDQNNDGCHMSAPTVQKWSLKDPDESEQGFCPVRWPGTLILTRFLFLECSYLFKINTFNTFKYAEMLLNLCFAMLMQGFCRNGIGTFFFFKLLFDVVTSLACLGEAT